MPIIVRSQHGPVVFMLSLCGPAGFQLVRQQEDPLQEEHREVPGGGQHLRHEDGPGGHAERRLAAHAKLHRSLLQLHLKYLTVGVYCIMVFYS